MKSPTWQMKIPFFKSTYLLRSFFLAYVVAIILTTAIIMAIFNFIGDGTF